MKLTTDLHPPPRSRIYWKLPPSHLVIHHFIVIMQRGNFILLIQKSYQSVKMATHIDIRPTS